MEADAQISARIGILRPVSSVNGNLIAVITPDNCLKVLRLADEGVLQEVVYFSFPKNLAPFAARVSHVKWAPGDDLTSFPFLLLSDGSRLLVIDPSALNILATSTAGPRTNSAAYLVADYQLGDQFGKLAYADFLLNDRHVIVIFEMGSHASVFALDKPQRDDIPEVKFNNRRSLSASPDGRSVALLLRSKGQDQVMVFSRKNEMLEAQSTFAPHTSDAQGVLWSPNGDPVLAVHDSAAFGTRISFFSALGHPLKQLDIVAFGDRSDVTGLGISTLKWSAAQSETMLAVGDGEKRVLVRRQDNRQMSVQPLSILSHSSAIDGSQSIVWQETGGNDNPFALQRGAFDAVADSSAGGDISILEFNSDCKFLATVTADNTKALWLWQPGHSDPHTIIMFQNPVHQVHWHPKRQDVLLILTTQKQPMVFIWHSEAKAPVPCSIPIQSPNSAKYHGSWSNRSMQGRHPFMLTTMKAFEVGMLEEEQGVVKFQSLLQESLHPGLEDDENDDSMEGISTPSKPSKRAGARHAPGIGRGLIGSRVASADSSRW